MCYCVCEQKLGVCYLCIMIHTNNTQQFKYLFYFNLGFEEKILGIVR